MQINKYLAITLAAVAVAAGCEWTGTSESDSWDDTYNIVNFSATYRGASGGAVATVPSSTTSSSTTNSSSTTTIRYSGTVTGSMKNGGTSMTITLPYGDLVAGSFSAYYDGISFADNGDGTLSSSENGAPTSRVSYTGGSAMLRFTGSHTENSVKVSFSYTKTSTTESGNSGSDSTTTSVIGTITVQQTGQHLSMTASNGQTFSGTISGMNLDSTLVSTATVSARFSVSSSNGDKIVGTLSDNTTQRTLNGTWVKKSGGSYDVQGYASAATRNVNYADTDAASSTTTTSSSSN